MLSDKIYIKCQREKYNPWKLRSIKHDILSVFYFVMNSLFVNIIPFHAILH